MIKTVIFDLGNVLIYFSHRRLFEQVGRLAGRSGEQMSDLIVSQGVLRRLENGSMSDDKFVQWMATVAGRRIDAEVLDRAMADIFWPNVLIRPMLDSLKSQGIRLVLLSNTCEYHVRWLEKHDTIFDYFDHLIFSCRAGLAKPDPKIFHLALEHAQCDPDECFYTDDIIENIDLANAEGLPGKVYTDTRRLKKHLAQRGVKTLP